MSVAQGNRRSAAAARKAAEAKQDAQFWANWHAEMALADARAEAEAARRRIRYLAKRAAQDNRPPPAGWDTLENVR